ncbi:bifunctional diguanylate cyclase/phosphodiesterase [Eubacterium callanderi]|uniref:bifunctional diguanylate cyclase/phosphodiesterase n=1 Tax=Eubacterium callanderi TaxID=53442 RepID=UPI001AA15777|nr:EAL domain-containing protein [Eubacterium callanderi]MBO1701884.1 EAL domain-containing protein [Eubacterium callanderi]
MKQRVKRRLLACAVILLILAFTAALGMGMTRALTGIRRSDAEQILHFYSEDIQFQLQGRLNEADALSQMALIMDRNSTAWFENAAAPLLSQEQVRYVCLIEGDTITSALPWETFGYQTGQSLRDLSYIFTLSKVVKELVIEGPVVLEGASDDRPVFLFLQPFVKDNAYLGEVALALDSEYVLGQLSLQYLSDQGYDYELWRVNPQNGGKDVIAVSGSNIDFSNAVKTSFNLPTEWNISIQPTDGWISPANRAVIISSCFAAALLMLGMACAMYQSLTRKWILKKVSTVDIQTGLYNLPGFTAALDGWLSDDSRGPVYLFYFVYESYNQVSQLIGPAEESIFLKSIPERLNAFIQSPFIAGRLGDGNFAIAVCEDMSLNQQEDFAKGVTLELLLRTRLNGKKLFLTTHYQYRHCSAGRNQAEKEITALVHSYYEHRSSESPAHRLTEKCRQLIAGQNNVTFDEYTDLEMMELSKTFNQYRKQVEQLAYFDPVFNVGNRSKYQRDANMLISYDKKRPFSLFCVDICAFSQYNQLFSADIGDRILHEVVQRLSRLFGNYLYRINGDVFLGITLSGEDETSFATKLQTLLSSPVTAGHATFTLRVRTAVCLYPANGPSPEILLDRIQSAMRYAKESGQKIMFYNDELDEIIRSEADIITRLEAAIKEETLEVWYQPIMHLATGSFSTAEALVRLPDGNGGYFSAGQAVALAERSGMVDQLGNYVLSRAGRFINAQGKALGLKNIHVNLSVQQLLVENISDHLLSIIRASGADNGQITLELTESVLIQSIEHASSTLEALRQAGIQIALDDFGVGYSSLNYLFNLPVDVIKIDRSLTQQICTSHKQRALLNSIVEMAEVNALTVVAEGVETLEDQREVAASGVQYIQGYYYARPMCEEALTKFLSQKTRASDN